MFQNIFYSMEGERRCDILKKITKSATNTVVSEVKIWDIILFFLKTTSNHHLPGLSTEANFPNLSRIFTSCCDTITMNPILKSKIIFYNDKSGAVINLYK